MIADVTAEVPDPKEVVAKYYGHQGDDGAHLVMNYDLTQVSTTCDGACVYKLVDDWMYATPRGAIHAWMVSIHSRSSE